MQGQMRAASQELQVLRSIIIRLSIQMMDDHARWDWTMEDFLHDDDVLKDIAVRAGPRMSWPADLDVSVCCPVSATFPIAVERTPQPTAHQCTCPSRVGENRSVRTVDGPTV